jgi:glycosyltransferase involved in cell wall biosynthesis
MRRFDHLIAVSYATKEEMVAAGVPSNLVSVVHNGIDTEAWSRRQELPSLRAALGLKDAFPVIGYVGRISLEKDLETWLRAAALVARQYPAARFIVVGEGRDKSLLDQLKSLAAALGIASNVEFLGYREDLPSIYATFDLFFLSSRREGICNSLLEAMAMEVPIVATNVGGTKELMLDGETGYLLSPADVEGMAQALISLVQNNNLRENMRQAGRRHIEDKFSFTARLQRIEALYERILEVRCNRRVHYPLLLPN